MTIWRACPDEVLYNDQIYVVGCTDHLVGFEQVRLKIPAQLRDQHLRVRYHSGDAETERRAWTVHGVDPAELIVLDERDTAFCDGGPAFPVAQWRWPLRVGGRSHAPTLVSDFDHDLINQR